MLLSLARRLSAPPAVTKPRSRPFTRSNYYGYFTVSPPVMRHSINQSTRDQYTERVTTIPRLSTSTRIKQAVRFKLANIKKNKIAKAHKNLRELNTWDSFARAGKPSVTCVSPEDHSSKTVLIQRPHVGSSPRSDSWKEAWGQVRFMSTRAFTRSPTRINPSTPQTAKTVDQFRCDRAKLVRINFGGVRYHSSVIQRRTNELNKQVPGDQLYEKLRDAKPKTATGFKDATRALYPLWHKVDSGERETVTFSDLQAALPPIFSIPWTYIAERITRGRVSALDGLTSYEKSAINFLRINNVGSIRAYEFVDAGARTFEDLEKLAARKQIKLIHSQKIGMAHLEDIERLIPRSEMDVLATTLTKVVKSVDPNLTCELLGSYRRRAEFSSDVDLTLRHESFIDKDDKTTASRIMTRIVNELEARGLVKQENQLMNGWKKYAGLIKLPGYKHFRRIDIRLAPFHSYPYLLLGCSGDALLMKLLRHTAKQKGWCLNEYGMGKKFDKSDNNPNGFRPGTLKVVENENEIFELLGLPYLEPTERDYPTWRDKYLRAGVDLSFVHKL
ncbi:hypothetical protein ACM66B_002458 [Microbotryomycetes sp. NB124-2]